MTGVRSSLLARVVFVGLALVTVAAFFITQRLKSSDPVVSRIATPLYLSPNGDGQKDKANVTFELPKGDNVTVAIVTEAGNVRRTLMDDKHLGRGRHAVVWDGRDDSGAGRPRRLLLRARVTAAAGTRGDRAAADPGRHHRAEAAARVGAARPRQGRRGALRERPDVSPPPVYHVYRTDGP